MRFFLVGLAGFLVARWGLLSGEMLARRPGRPAGARNYKSPVLARPGSLLGDRRRLSLIKDRTHAGHGPARGDQPEALISTSPRSLGCLSLSGLPAALAPRDPRMPCSRRTGFHSGRREQPLLSRTYYGPPKTINLDHRNMRFDTMQQDFL